MNGARISEKERVDTPLLTEDNQIIYPPSRDPKNDNNNIKNV